MESTSVAVVMRIAVNGQEYADVAETFEFNDVGNALSNSGCGGVLDIFTFDCVAVFVGLIDRGANRETNLILL